MTSRPALQTPDSNFYDPLSVQPWRKLVDNICQNLDSTDFRKFLFFSKDWLSRENHEKFSKFKEPGDYIELFSILEDCLGEREAVEHLKYLVNAFAFYGGVGEIDYKEWIERYRETVEHAKKYIQICAEKRIIFVGKELLENVLGYLRQDYKGVVLCGVSGIGKTSLASQVCLSLVLRKPTWHIVVMNQRERTDLNELLLDLISNLCEEMKVEKQIQLNPDTDLRYLIEQCKMLISELVERQLNTIILLDNMDGHCDAMRRSDFCDAMKEILNKIPPNCNVKILMTVGLKLSRLTQTWNENEILDRQMIELELKYLAPDDTAGLLRKISDKNERVCWFKNKK